MDITNVFVCPTCKKGFHCIKQRVEFRNHEHICKIQSLQTKLAKAVEFCELIIKDCRGWEIEAEATLENLRR